MSDSQRESSPAARTHDLPGGPPGLQDHPQLRDVLRKQDEYMMRLVNASLHRTLAATPSHPADRPPPPRSSSPSPTPGAQGGPRLRGPFPRYPPVHPTTAPTGAAWPPHEAQGPRVRDDAGGEVDASSGGGVPYVPVQMLWWQQMYAWHYYIQQQVAATSTSPSPSRTTPSPSHSSFLTGTRPSSPQHPPPPTNAAQWRQQQLRGPGAEGDELVPGYDWLERLYTVSNVCVLVSIMYFSSSASLLVIMAGAMLLVYLHQNAWFPFRPEQQVQNPAGGGARGGVRGGAPGEEAERQPEAAAAAGGGGGSIGERRSEGNGRDAGGGGSATARRAPRGFLSAIWNFITAFFLSLIPEGHWYTGN